VTPEALACLHAACFTVPRPWSAEEFAALLGGEGVILVSESTGFALGRVAADEAEVLTIAVDPAARRKGIGARLLRGLLADAVARGATEAFLEVAADNAAALALYRGAGFAEVGRRKGYYSGRDGPATDALVLRQRLAPGRPEI
jgi:ribosomal-protein-alanine N-acetyltransferase